MDSFMVDISTERLIRSANFKDLELLAAKILNQDNVKLQIPNTLSFSGGFGMEGAVLQVFATWLRSSRSHIIHTAASEPGNSELFESLCNQLFGLCALRLADKVWSTSKLDVSIQTALKPAIPIFQKLRAEDYKNAFKGMYLTIPAIKAPVVPKGRDREYDSPLYNNDQVVGAEKFFKITDRALKAVLPNSVSHSSINDQVIENLSEILRELFTNTHRHARADVKGHPYKKNFRGIIFNMIELSASRMDELSTASGASVLFLGDWKPSGNEKFRALDITVVDSGPGYARRWHGLDKDKLTLEQEKVAIVECFTKHRSSDQTDSSGSGLSNVLRDLKELKGWFRLRTGRTLVEKSFFNYEGSNRIELENIKEMDSFMEGVVFNVVIPLKSLVGK
ncbi:hypothetical protein [Amphritea sp. HPY]|uniref:hypothetical protein n=1 Tax=Amphritea sp. HPY TaxID=3421652 RepID=UPI003D7E8A34